MGCGKAKMVNFGPFLNEISSALRSLFPPQDCFLHKVINTGLNLLFSEINYSCKVLLIYIVTNSIR